MVGGTFERYLQIGRGRSKASLEAQMPVDSNFQFARGQAMNCVSVLGIGDVDLFPGVFGGSCAHRWARCSRGVPVFHPGLSEVPLVAAADPGREQLNQDLNPA